MGKKERLPQLVSASTDIAIQDGKREGRRKGMVGRIEGRIDGRKEGNTTL